MNKRFLIILVALLWCNVGVAEIKIIEEISASKLRKTITPKADSAFPILRICVDGLEFVSAGHGSIGPGLSS